MHSRLPSQMLVPHDVVIVRGDGPISDTAPDYLLQYYYKRAKFTNLPYAHKYVLDSQILTFTRTTAYNHLFREQLP